MEEALRNAFLILREPVIVGDAKQKAEKARAREFVSYYRDNESDAQETIRELLKELDMKKN